MILNVSAPPDANGNGLPDAWELRYFGAMDSPQGAPDADPDADAAAPVAEVEGGGEPLPAPLAGFGSAFPELLVFRLATRFCFSQWFRWEPALAVYC